MKPKLATEDFDKLFARTPNTILVNNIPMRNREERDKFNQLLMQTYTMVDVLSPIPTCSCGGLKGGYYLNTICGSCGTQVERPTEESIGEKIWLMAPEETLGFINPRVFNALSSYLSTNSFNVLAWLLDPKLEPPTNLSDKPKKQIATFVLYDFPRGLNNFILNYDWFIDIISNMKPKSIPFSFREWLIAKKPITFPRYLPLPTKALLVLENTAVGCYSDSFIEAGINSARIISNISPLNRRANNTSIPIIESKVVNALINYTRFYVSISKAHINTKGGVVRGQCLKTRSHFTLRAVITSITDEHNYWEIHIPYGASIELFKIHLISKLLKRGWIFKAAYDYIDGSGLKFDPFLHQLMTEVLMEETSYGGCTHTQRNPTLRRLSIQNLFISKIKTDIEDKTISLSVLVINGFNADYDGDEMQILLILGKEMQKNAAYLAPHYGIISIIKPGQLNDAVDLPNVASTTIANWVNGYTPF
jgi:RNA polymerase Rpb1, domain 2